MLVKICGINSAAAFDAASGHGADFLGFVFAPSPRQVSPGEAAALSARRPGGPRRVGLFVAGPAAPTPDAAPDAALDAGPDAALGAAIAGALAQIDLDVLQIYAPAALLPGLLPRLRARFGPRELWLSCPVTSQADLPATALGADRLVIEPKAAAGDPRPGGLGRALDWGMLAGWDPGFAWMLAGGLTPGNVAAAIAASHAAAVDVSSGVEEAPGVKSPAMIAAFIRAARGG